MNWISIGAVLGFLSVAFGAFGAHALSGRLDEPALKIYQTAVQYQMFHALALLLWALWKNSVNSSSSLTGWCFLIGILIFSGSLYALSLTGVKMLGAITPVGGLLFLVGWASFVWRTLRTS